MSARWCGTAEQTKSSASGTLNQSDNRRLICLCRCKICVAPILTTNDKGFTGSSPDVYDEFLVLLIFEDHAADLARTPHGYADVQQIHDDLEQAGFTNINIETVTGVNTAPDASHPATAYVKGTPLRGEIEPHGAEMLAQVETAATQEIARLYGNGRVSAKIQGLVITAT